MNKVDFWRGPARPSLPVDMRVPFSELKDVKDYLESHGLAYSVMIKDIQVRARPALPFWFGLNVEKKDPGLRWRRELEEVARASVRQLWRPPLLPDCPSGSPWCPSHPQGVPSCQRSPV